MAHTEDIPTGLRLNDLGGAEIVCGRFQRHRFPRHSHEGLMLSLIEDGTQCVRYRGETHLGGRGVLIAIPPEDVHAGEPRDDHGWYYRTITIPTGLIQSLTGLQDRNFLCATILQDDVLMEALAQVFDLFGRAPVLQQEEALAVVLARFLSRHADARPPVVRTGTEYRAVDACKQFLAARPDQNVSLSDLEGIAGIDQFRLVRCFTRLEGLPPHAWHLQHRLRQAQDMLSRGDQVVDVAYAVGFSDQAHLTRAFKRLTGLTPGRYRRAHS